MGIGALHNGYADLFEPEIFQKLTGNFFDRLPELNFTGKNILKSSD
jgi:hypothetical protein